MKDVEAIDFLERQMVGCRKDNKNKFADSIQWALLNFTELEEARETIKKQEEWIEEMQEQIDDLERETFEGYGIF